MGERTVNKYLDIARVLIELIKALGIKIRITKASPKDKEKKTDVA